MKDWKFHCAVLGVRDTADLREVRKAYRKLALALHPDKHNNSQSSKEDFQQLNESYRHVAAALIAGHRPEPAPPHPAPASPPQKPAQAARPPTAQPRGEPHRQLGTGRGKIRPVWLHAAVACFALLVLSIFVERPVKQLPDYKPESKELFMKNWCFISRLEGGAPKKEVSELWSQPVCEEKCTSMASGSDVACTWNGQEFRAFREPPRANPPALAAVDDSASPCEITVEKASGLTSTPYRSQTETSCRAICEATIRMRSSDGIRCTWEGREFLSQAITRPGKGGLPVPDYSALPKEAKSQPPTFPAKAVTASDIPAATLNADTGISYQNTGFKASCYMSVVSEDGSRADEFPNDTADRCEGRCMAEISSSPTGKEIKCSFAGKALITYVPDPMVSYINRDPSSSGFHQGTEFMASCQIFARMGEKRAQPKSDVTTEQLCQVKCKADYLQRPKGVEVVCQFNGETFFQKTVTR